MFSSPAARVCGVTVTVSFVVPTFTGVTVMLLPLPLTSAVMTSSSSTEADRVSPSPRPETVTACALPSVSKSSVTGSPSLSTRPCSDSVEAVKISLFVVAKAEICVFAFSSLYAVPGSSHHRQIIAPTSCSSLTLEPITLFHGVLLMFSVTFSMLFAPDFST